MNRNSFILPLAIIIIFLLPNSLSRFLIDLTGGLILISILIPLLLVAIAWMSLRTLKAKSYNCKSCGANYFGSLNQCPICGSTENTNVNVIDNNLPASDTTIDVIAEESE